MKSSRRNLCPVDTDEVRGWILGGAIAGILLLGCGDPIDEILGDLDLGSSEAPFPRVHLEEIPECSEGDGAQLENPWSPCWMTIDVDESDDALALLIEQFDEPVAGASGLRRSFTISAD